MKNIVGVLFITLLLWGCQKQPEYPIDVLNGYWEIEKVTLTDGSEKLYNYNPTIDFFVVKDSSGIRKKVQPKFDGTFLASDDIKTFTLKQENDSLRLFYKTPLASWKETIIRIHKTQLLIKNDQGIIYQYKPYQKIEL